MPFTQNFWEAVAGRIHALPVPADWIVLVPAAAHVSLLRSALARLHGTMLLPQITTLNLWQASWGAPLPDAVAERVTLFSALLEERRLGDQLGATPEQLWALTRELTAVCDELTAGCAPTLLGPAVADRSALVAQLDAATRAVYRAAATRACSDEARLVLGLWRATLEQDRGAAGRLATLAELADRADRPLAVVVPPEWDAPARAFEARYAGRQPVLRLWIDRVHTLAPALAAAWPELTGAQGAQGADGAGSGGETGREVRPRVPAESGPQLNLPLQPAPEPERELLTAPLLERARGLREHGTPLPAELCKASSLEEEASIASDRILGWLRAGVSSIGVVVLDRAVARRVRALLERADVLVRDESGWKLSTTTVAGALMRWLELASSGEERLQTRVLLDWLKSRHAFALWPEKDAAVVGLESVMRAENLTRGWNTLVAALRRAAERAADGAGDSEGAAASAYGAALALLGRLRPLLAAPGRRLRLAEHFEWLDDRLTATDMRASFAEDAAGATLLATLEGLAHSVDRAADRFSFAQWVGFVGDGLENSNFRDDAIDSPVSFYALEGAAWRPVEHLLVLGADAAHAPGQTRSNLFLAPGLRRELRLVTTDVMQREALFRLAALMSAARWTTLTWQGRRERSPNPLAPSLERLRQLHDFAFGPGLSNGWTWPLYPVPADPVFRPAPSAPALMPDHVSASAAATLVNCPYKFYAERMLGLVELKDMSEELDKRDWGELVHQILERFHAAVGNEGGRAELMAALAATAQGVFDERSGGDAAFLGYRARFDGLLAPYVDWWIKWRAQGHEVRALEEAWTQEFRDASGTSIRLVGRIDRLDSGPEGAVLIDYKTRAPKRLRDGLATPGEDVQLPFYRLLLGPRTPVATAAYLSLNGAAVTLVPPEQPIDVLADDVAARLAEDVARLRAGGALPANGAASVCRYCGVRGVCRKGHWSDAPVVPAAAAAGPPGAGELP